MTKKNIYTYPCYYFKMKQLSDFFYYIKNFNKIFLKLIQSSCQKLLISIILTFKTIICMSNIKVKILRLPEVIQNDWTNCQKKNRQLLLRKVIEQIVKKKSPASTSKSDNIILLILDDVLRPPSIQYTAARRVCAIPLYTHCDIVLRN